MKQTKLLLDIKSMLLLQHTLDVSVASRLREDPFELGGFQVADAAGQVAAGAGAAAAAADGAAGGLLIML